MREICRCTFYYLSKTKYFIKALIVFLLITIACLIPVVSQMRGHTFNEFLAAFNTDACTMFGMITVVSFIAIALGNEFRNKTIYYAVINGHTRFEIFFGKLIGLLPCVIMMSLLQSGILYAAAAIITDGKAGVQYFLLTAPSFMAVYISYAVLSLSFSFAAQSTIGGIGGSLAVFAVYNIISYLLSFTELKLFSYNVFGLIGMFVFDCLLENYSDIGLQLSVTAIYAVLSVVYLFAAYHRFKKQDLV